MIKGSSFIGSTVEVGGKFFTAEKLIAEGGFGFVYQVYDNQ